MAASQPMVSVVGTRGDHTKEVTAMFINTAFMGQGGGECCPIGVGGMISLTRLDMDRFS